MTGHYISREELDEKYGWWRDGFEALTLDMSQYASQWSMNENMRLEYEDTWRKINRTSFGNGVDPRLSTRPVDMVRGEIIP